MVGKPGDVSVIPAAGSSPDNLLAVGVKRIQALRDIGSTREARSIYRQLQTHVIPERSSLARRDVGVLAGQLVGRWGEANPGLAGVAKKVLAPFSPEHGPARAGDGTGFNRCSNIGGGFNPRIQV